MVDSRVENGSLIFSKDSSGVYFSSQALNSEYKPSANIKDFSMSFPRPKERVSVEKTVYINFKMHSPYK
jgi:hypothetical protein